MDCCLRVLTREYQGCPLKSWKDCIMKSTIFTKSGRCVTVLLQHLWIQNAF